MPPFALKQYLTQLDDAWSRRRGGVAAELLSLRDQHADGTLLAGHTNDQLELQCQRCLAPPLDDLAAAHLRCVRSLSDGECTQAFTHQSAVVSVFAKAFVTHKDDNWALPVMYAVCLDLRRVAAGADVERVRAGTGFSGELLEKAAEGMMACFRVCAGDTRAEVSDTKRWGLLTLVNQLFKIYFRVQKLHLCRPLVRAIESLPFSSQFSLAQQLTYHYYIGCKAMFDCQYTAAKESLMFAFTRCHRSSHKNKRLILVYLIPVCMLLGSMPRDSLLTKYRLRQFAPVVAAVRQGSLGRLSAAMTASQTFFISCGVYLILEKLRTITQRNLFKKVYCLSGSVQVDIGRFQRALVFSSCHGADTDKQQDADAQTDSHTDEDPQKQEHDVAEDPVDVDETVCILANLIYEGRIKGYISHAHQKLVLSKKEPFPSIAAAASVSA